MQVVLAKRKGFITEINLLFTY